MQYLIFLTNGEEENCVLITSNKSSAISKLDDFKLSIKRDNAWFELRMYENESSEEYVVIEN